MNKFSIRMRLTILLSAMWVLAFLEMGIDLYYSVFIYGIMPVVIAWGLFWINSRWSRIGIIITFIWIVFLRESGAYQHPDFLIGMILPALVWGIVLSRDKWWK